MKLGIVIPVVLVAAVGVGLGMWLAFEPSGPSAPAGTASAPATTGSAAGSATVDTAATGTTTAAGEATTGTTTGGTTTDGAGAGGTGGSQADTGQPTTGDVTASGETAGETAASQSAPAFDVVRVEKDGATVIAGRAEPGAEVKLLDGDQTLAQVTAGSDGAFAVVLDKPLEPGSRTLSLSAENQDGQTVASSNEVVVVVPQPAASAAATAATGDTAATGSAAASSVQPSEPIVVIASRDEAAEPSTVLQVPGGGLASGALNIEAVDYDLEGQVAISGKAPAGTTVLLYLDEALIGQATADAAGLWSVKPNGSVTPGLHRLRVDLLDAAGKVTARVETPFSRAEPIELAENKTFVVVQPGNNLWLIARGHYGKGVRYTAIYEANAGQIRDPDLIYPGQIFLIPESN